MPSKISSKIEGDGKVYPSGKRDPNESISEGSIWKRRVFYIFQKNQFISEEFSEYHMLRMF